MKKYNLYAGMKSEHYNLHKLEAMEFATLAEAKLYCEEFAESLYYWNPDRDILEIMAQDNRTEDEAEVIFIKEMLNSIIYHLEELAEFGGEVVEIIEHRWLT